MENTIKPDKKYQTAQLLILSVLSSLIIIGAVVLNIIIYLEAGSDLDGIMVIWLLCLGLISIMWIVSFPLIYLWIKNLSYFIHDDRITIQSGIITKKEQNIPYRSITDFVLERGPFDRILGIGTIKIQTAGQSTSATGYEGSLSGLLDYEPIHTDLREKLKSLHPISESITTSESVKQSDDSVLVQILEELKEIRRNTEK
jgi:hypothetical protein